MTLSLSDQELNEIYISGQRGFVTEKGRLGLLAISLGIKSGEYQITTTNTTLWTTEQKSHLIESIIINIPIPPIIFYQQSFNRYSVVDGNQRLRAIADFYSNRFELTNVEVYPELNGCCYRTLPQKVRDGLDRRWLSLITVIKPSNNQFTHDQAKQLIRERYEYGVESNE